MKKKKILPFVTKWMELKGYAKWNVRERQILLGVTYLWNPKKEKLIETQIIAVVARDWVMEEIGRDW